MGWTKLWKKRSKYYSEFSSLYKNEHHIQRVGSCKKYIVSEMQETELKTTFVFFTFYFTVLLVGTEMPAQFPDPAKNS